MVLYSIQEVANQLNVTRMTIYKKIDSMKELGKYIKVQQGVKYINKTGIDILRKSIKKLQNDCIENIDGEESLNDIQVGMNDIQTKVNEDTKECVEFDVTEDMKEFEKYTDLQEKFNESLKTQILDLKNQLEVKDKQIESLHEEIGHQRQLHQNTQVLLKQMQDKVFLLEEADNKQQVKNSWLKRWFG